MALFPDTSVPNLYNGIANSIVALSVDLVLFFMLVDVARGYYGFTLCSQLTHWTQK